LRWGAGEHERCQLAYDHHNAPEAALLRIQATCLGTGGQAPPPAPKAQPQAQTVLVAVGTQRQTGAQRVVF